MPQRASMDRVTVALDATYSVGAALSGVGVYSRELLWGLAALRPEDAFRFCYRPHRLLRSFRDRLPANARRSVLHERWLPDADLFHGLNQRLPAQRLRRAVVTFHDLFVLTGDYSTPEFRERFAAQARDAAHRADLILTVSEFTAGQVRDLPGVPAGCVRAIPHGVHLPDEPVPPPDQRERVVLSVGALQRRKNTLRLVEAFEQMPAGWRLVLAGSGGYEADVIGRRVNDSTRRGDILLTGYLSAPALKRWFQRAAVFAFPSLDEGFGLPVLEAMAWGVPVLTSNRSALPEASGGCALLVDPFEVEEIAEGLRRLATDEPLRRDLVRRGQARAAQCPWTATVARTWEAYQSLW